MDEAFDAGLDFDERAVGDEFRDDAFDVGADREPRLDVFPRVGLHLLEAERNALFLAVHVEDQNLDGLADLNHFARVVDPAPAHVRDVEQAVHAAEVDEDAEVGDVLDHALDDVADLDGLEELLALLGALGLDDLTAGEDDVLPLVVDFDDFEFVDLAEVFVEIFRRDDVDLGAGEESFDADVDHEAAFDDGFDFALHEAAVVEDFDDLVPVLLVGGFLFREDDHALVVFEFFEEDFDLVPDFEFLVFEFGDGDGPFGFVSDVDEDKVVLKFKDAAVDDTPLAVFPEIVRDELFEFV